MTKCKLHTHRDGTGWVTLCENCERTWYGADEREGAAGLALCCPDSDDNASAVDGGA